MTAHRPRSKVDRLGLAIERSLERIDRAIDTGSDTKAVRELERHDRAMEAIRQLAVAYGHAVFHLAIGRKYRP